MKKMAALLTLLFASGANAFDCPAEPGGLVCINTHVPITEIATPPPASQHGKRVAATLVNDEWVILIPVEADNETGKVTYTDVTGTPTDVAIGNTPIPKEHIAMSITNASQKAKMSDADAAELKVKTDADKERLMSAIGQYSMEKYGHTFVWPSVEGTRLTSSYSFRTRKDRAPRAHKAMDVGRKPCTDEMPDILSASAGKVVLAEKQHYLGNLVVVDHGFGLMTAYAHLSEIAVSVGDILENGQRVGVMGATGNVAGPHLHFIFYVNGVPVLPQALFPKEYAAAASVEKCKK